MKQIFLGLVFGIAAVLGGTRSALAQDASIAAVVNGQVITNDDVANRARLLALSSGMKATPVFGARL